MLTRVGRCDFPCRPTVTDPAGFQDPTPPPKSLATVPSSPAAASATSPRPRSTATSSDSTPRPRRRGRWQVARTAARSAAPEGARLAEAGPEARRGHRRRRARGGSPLLVELGEVAGQGRVPRAPGRRATRRGGGALRRAAKRWRPGSSGRAGVIQTMRASTRSWLRAAGVFSGIRPMASSAITRVWARADRVAGELDDYEPMSL